MHRKLLKASYPQFKFNFCWSVWCARKSVFETSQPSFICGISPRLDVLFQILIHLPLIILPLRALLAEAFFFCFSIPRVKKIEVMYVIGTRQSEIFTNTPGKARKSQLHRWKSKLIMLQFCYKSRSWFLEKIDQNELWFAVSSIYNLFDISLLVWLEQS